MTALVSTVWSLLQFLITKVAKLRVQHWLICIYAHLWPFMFKAIPDGAPSLCYLTASQLLHPTPPHQPPLPPPAASRDKLTLWSTSWCFVFFKPLLLHTVPRWRCCFWSVYGMVRRMYLHQNVETSDNILMTAGVWWVCWRWQQSNYLVDWHTGLTILLQSFFKKSCHAAIFYPLHLCT